MIPKQKIEDAAKAYSTIEIKEGNENDALFSSRGGMKQLVERSFSEGVSFAEKETKATVSDLDILYAATDKTVDLRRKEGFIQGAKWFRNHVNMS